ncbi:FAD/NAD(P)-binding domain [Phytophthora cactorum]|nr:FAD/NAD(P)-binding domain [Phytophthora cactorum]
MTRIVIIGGGPAGINTAQALAKNLTEADKTEVVVLEKNAYFYHVVGALGLTSTQTSRTRMFVPYDNAFPKNATKFVRIVRGVATQISSNTNEVLYRAIDKYDMESSGTTALHFDYLVLAMGSTYTVPIKQDSHDYARSATESKLQQVRSHIETANKILVVGGGSVGCEVAAEIKAKYPPRIYAKLNASLAELGVKVMLGERLTERLTANGFERRTLWTNKGTAIESDIQLLCGGFHPVAELVQDMDPNMQLQLEGARYSNMFALGDVCNHPSPKMSFIAGQQGTFLVGELIAVIRKKQPSFTKPFPGAATEVMNLASCPNGGSVMGNWVRSENEDIVTPEYSPVSEQAATSVDHPATIYE